MEFNELKELAEVLMTVQANRKIKHLKKNYRNPNKLKGIYFNAENKELPLHIEYFPENDSVRAATDIPHFHNYTLGVQTVKRLKEYKRKKITFKDLDVPIMTRKQLAAKVKACLIKVELHGHFAGFNGNNKPTAERFKQKFLEDYKHLYDGSRGKFDGTWSKDKGKSIEDTNKGMRNFYSLDVNRKFKAGDVIMSRSDDSKCSCCGKGFDIVLRDVDTITIAPGYFMREAGDFNLVCDFPKGPTHSEGEIKVASDLVFANFFRPLKSDAPKGKEYSDEFSLSTFAGRRGITSWKAKNQNVAYGQMGNMSLSVWVNEDKDHIVLTESYIETAKKEKTLADMGMKQVGKDISLAVWRWEATDVKTLEAAAKKKMPAIKKDMKEDYKDVVVVPVKRGRWKFNHYYDTSPDPKRGELFIYAELKLIKK